MIGRLLAFGAVAFFSGANPAAADAIFDVETTHYVDMLAPVYRPQMPLTIRLTIRLSGRNTVTVTRSRLAGSVSDQSGGMTNLGQEAGNLTGRWRVVNANLLEGRLDFPQSYRIMRLRVHGANCEFSYDDRLKPGYDAYLFSMIGARRAALFSKPQVVQSSCRARSE